MTHKTGERERERKRERETERDRERQRQRQRETERDRERDRETGFLSKRVRTGKYDTESLTFYNQRSGNLSQIILKAWILWQRLN